MAVQIVIRRAFTLVELLVVIGIMTILIGLLLPALAAGRQQAQSLQCLSNLRQMVLAAMAYSNANSGMYPIAYFDSEAWDFTTLNAGTPTATIVPGLLWQGSADMRIQQCPSYDGPSDTPTDPYTGYNYNTSYIGHGQYESVATPIKVSQVRWPSRCAIFGDGQYSSGANKYMRAPFPNPGDVNFNYRWTGTQGFRHRGKTNVAFCDGHAESLGQIFTNMDPLSGTASQIGAGTGFLSNDNSLYDPQARPQ